MFVPGFKSLVIPRRHIHRGHICHVWYDSDPFARTWAKYVWFASLPAAGQEKPSRSVQLT